MRMKPVTQGEWVKIARKHYRHISGVEVRYNCNGWCWDIIGGANDGSAYGLLWVAQHAATERSEP